MAQTTAPIPDQYTPLLGDRLPDNRTLLKRDQLAGLAIQLGLIVFAALVTSVLLRVPFAVFSFHPLMMTCFLVLIIEGVTLLQPTHTAPQKARGLRWHAAVQSASYLSAICGFSAIIYNKILSNKAHFTSAHGKLGLVVFSFLSVQVIFGITIAYVPRLFGGVTKAKSLWKYHRMSGYALLALAWFTAQLGVRAEYMLDNLWSDKLLWLHIVATLLVVGGVATRVRISKWGFN